MSTPEPYLESDPQSELPALPTIRKEAAPSARGRQPAVPSEEPEDEDDGSGLWIEDDEPGEQTPLSSPPESPAAEVAPEELPDPDELFRQMQGAGPAADELPDPDELFRQMQGAGPLPQAADELPDPDELFRQMQGAGPLPQAVEELPDPDELFRQMQGAGSLPQAAEELPDPDELFRQMQGAGSFPRAAEELPDPDELFRQMQGGGSPSQAADELPDPDELFRQLQAGGSLPQASEDLPDPDELFLQLQAGDSLPQASEDLPDPDELFLQLQGVGSPSQAADELPDPDELFLQLQGGGSLPQASEDLPDPDELFLQLQAGDSSPQAADELPDPDELFLQLQGGGSLPQAADELPDPDELFRQLQGGQPVANEAEYPIPDALSLEPPGQLAHDSSLPDPEVLFLQLQALEESQAPSAPDFGLADPFGLSAGAPDALDSLPDPETLFLQMQSQASAEVDIELPPIPETLTAKAPDEENGGLFSRLKAAFTREKNDGASAAAVGAAWVGSGDLLPGSPDEESSSETLPSPDELFRQFESDEQESPLAPTPEGLPALPDLDAFRAELEAEEKARLDADLLGDLSGPERFASTVSDFEFKAGTFFSEPPDQGAVHKPAPPRQDKHLLPPAPPPRTDEPLPAMLSRPEPTPKPKPLASPPPKVVGAVATPLVGAGSYQATPKPVREKSSSTAIMPASLPQAARAKQQVAERLARYRARRKAISLHALTMFTRQLAAMLKAGIALHQSISFCAESDPDAAPMLEDICGKIESGFSFSGALREFPESFNAVYIGLVHAGELSGRLNEMLGRLADILERELELRKRMISVVTYPAMLMGVSILGTLGFIFFVLPQLEPMFLDLNVDLPWPTQVLLSLRSVLLPIAVVLGLVLIVLTAMKGKIFAYVAARPGLERKLAYIPLSTPVLGKVYEKLVTARVLYSLATMLEVGVPMSQALARAEGTSGNAYIGYRLSRARQDLSDGSSVTECFAINQVFPDTALQLISAGEESARLVDMFTYVARHFDEEVEQSMNAAAGLLEPLIMVGMGLVVGFIVVAAALPTIKLLQGF